MKQKFLLVFSCTLFLLTSCNKNTVNDALEGTWIIEDISYGEHSIMKCFTSNFLTFENEDCKLPYWNRLCSIKEKTQVDEYLATWKLTDDSRNQLQLLTRNELFKGSFKVKFIGDSSRKLLLLHLESNDVKLKAWKLGFAYKDNIDFVRRLTGNNKSNH